MNLTAHWPAKTTASQCQKRAWLLQQNIDCGGKAQRRHRLCPLQPRLNFNPFSSARRRRGAPLPAALQVAHVRLAAALLLATFFLTLAAPSAAAHGDLHERIAALTEQLHTNRTDAELWLRRADLERQHGDFPAALADLAEAARLKTNWPAADLQFARIHFDREKFPEAIAAATACLQRDTNNADALVLRARSSTRLEQFAAAAADYDRVLTNASLARPLPDLYLERAHAQAARGQLAAAIAGLDAAMKRLGETPSFALPALEYERQRGDFDAALDRLNRTQKFFTPENFFATRGEILLQAKRRPEAAEVFQAALASLEKLPPERRALPQTAALEARLRAGVKEASLPRVP